MLARIKKVEKVLKAEKADVLLVVNNEGSGQPATSWLSGFTGSSSILLSTKTKRFLITDGRYISQSKKEVSDFVVLISSRENTTLQIVNRYLAKTSFSEILFDGGVTSYSEIEELQKNIPTALFVSKKNVLQELRAVKDTDEQDTLRKASDIACRSLHALIPRMSQGMTEKEIAKILESICSEEGGEGMSFPTIVASGRNGAFPHAKPTLKKIANGELVTIDFGVRYKGYVSDMTRTLAVGKISPRLKEIYEAVREAQELGCQKAKAGMTGAEIDAVCRDYLTKKGLGNYFTHSTGHGIGMEVHELPSISASAQVPLSAGSVITCEPGIYIPNVGGVRIEDALILTQKGSHNLTESVSKDLIHL
ncbi:MAG: hypothetical protein COV91_05625 [Candidatus Taylorbacteria bacterium CG11_big_fil_rev_8_21_14_0_20_46_11]|uniref:Xaa-Pro dipeptidase n=1 Tax=Candidatus Taylorbacteria bacterium CG11_big_fil_rev_8_21_14_0_20_46_11 TaxID=1975025 RepID=A0A2H0KAA2_9BACT|nr:MAG: hypothetical protein COV91_05625 [Candidatus Taylorbacteria bacterium CG11_big_fil_rev_8_21_14_0_20_46_11]